MQVQHAKSSRPKGKAGPRNSPRSKQQKPQNGSRPKANSQKTGGIRNEASLVRAIDRFARTGENSTAADEIGRILRGICMPNSDNVIKFGDAYSTSATAANALHKTFPVGWNTASTTGTALPKTDAVAFGFRNLQRAAVVYDSNTGGIASEYIAYQDEQSSGLVLTPPATSQDYHFEETDTATNVSIPFMLPTTAYKPHGNKIYAGVPVSGAIGRYFWYDAQDELIVTSVAPVDTAIHYTLDLWTPNQVNEGVISKHSVIGPSVTTVKSNTDPAGYYALNLQVEGTVPATVTLTNIIVANSGGSHFSHFAAQDLENNDTKIFSNRVLATSTLFTNTTAQIALGGDIAIAQIPAGRSWTEFVPPDGGYGMVASLNGAKTERANDGGYTFLKPTTDLDVQMTSGLAQYGGFLVDSFYNLNTTSDFTCMYIVVPDPTLQAGQWKITQLNEFRTTDQWIATAVPQVNDSLYRQAMIVLRNIPQAYSNGTHWADIWDKIKEGVKFILPYAKPLAKLALDAI